MRSAELVVVRFFVSILFSGKPRQNAEPVAEHAKNSEKVKESLMQYRGYFLG
jgi:hypothetical protein